MPLVMFLDACEHCARICNILRHIQNMSLSSTCQSMALSKLHKFVELNHWQGRVLSQPSGNVLLLGVRILDVMSPCEFYLQLFKAAFMHLTNCICLYYCFAFFMVFTIVGALGCWNLMSKFCNHHHPTHPAPRWNHHASHLSNKSCYLALYWAAIRSVEVDVRAWQDCPRTWTCHSCKKSWCRNMIQTIKQHSEVWTCVDDVGLPLPGMRVLSNRGGQRPYLFPIFISCFVNISIVPWKFLVTWSEEAMGWLNSVMLLSSIGDCANGRMMMAELLVHGPFLCFLPQDVKKCLMKCGVEDKVQVFLFCCLAILSSTFFPFLVQQSTKHLESFCHALGDTQIVKEDFVEAINNVLNSLHPSMSPERCVAYALMLFSALQVVFDFRWRCAKPVCKRGSALPHCIWQNEWRIHRIHKQNTECQKSWDWGYLVEDMESISGACRQLCPVLRFVTSYLNRLTDLNVWHVPYVW